MPVTHAYLTMAVKFVSQNVYGDGVIRLREVQRLDGSRGLSLSMLIGDNKIFGMVSVVHSDLSLTRRSRKMTTNSRGYHQR